LVGEFWSNIVFEYKRELSMKKSKFNETKILAILKEAEAGMAVSEISPSMAYRVRPFTTGRANTPG